MKPSKPHHASRKAHVEFDMSLFEPSSVRNEILLENAVAILEGYLVNPNVDKQQLLLKLQDRQLLLPLIVSVLSTPVFAQLSDWIVEHFPSTAAAFKDSFCSRLLEGLTHSFGSLGHPAANLQLCQRAVELARPALDALALLCSIESSNDDEVIIEDVGRRKMPQSLAKKMKRATRMPHVDPAVFERLDESVPENKEDAIELSSKVIADQKNILKYYLDVLRSAEIAGLIRDAYTAAPFAVNDDDDTNDPSTEVANNIPEPHRDADTATSPAQWDPTMVPDLHFDSAQGFGDWRIILAARAGKDLAVAYKRSPTTLRAIVKKLRDLSHGRFLGDNQKRLAGPDSGIPIFEAKVTGDTRLVYRIDCVQEYGSEVESQALRVYGIYTHAQLRGDRFWDAVSRTVGLGPIYRERCIYRTTSTRSDTVSPATWPPRQEVVKNEDMYLPDLSQDDLDELRSLLILEKYVPFSQALVNSITSDYRDINHPFYMSQEEQTIVRHNGSCFVLGRSGTGKTTTMIFKMIGMERRWHSQHEDLRADMARPRQVFVTQSRVLADKVEDYFHNAYRVVEAETRTVSESATRKTSNRDQGMVDKDEEDRHRDDLTRRFSELTDDDFPLFITTDYLCRLLEADFATSTEQEEREVDKYTLTKAVKSQPSRNATSITYSNFLANYWAHLPQNLTKGFTPSSVFAEFMGVIKGSELTLSGDKGYLDRATYCGMSSRATTFTAQRENLYSLFEAYVKLKNRRGEFDPADRTQSIIRNLKKYGVPGKQVDYIYIDEAQDNLLIDAWFLRHICRRPFGVFWAGDTAQTISAGSSFRFNELKAFMHRVEHGTNRHQPKSFQLSKNYRSHGGIVKCGHTVVELLVKFWPHTIDVLSEERGMIAGPLPVFFRCGEANAPEFADFRSEQSDMPLEFGAKQCILVFDDSASERLREEHGNIGIVMTINESKGLEFDDVLLYNFFADSGVSASQWRVVMNVLTEGQREPLSVFEELKHHGLCRVLKCLYVAITRARLNLWIIDYSDNGESMRRIWSSKSQIETWYPGMRIPNLVKESSPAEWAEQADKLFNNKNYLQAQHAYHKAGQGREASIAGAYYLREAAWSHSGDHQSTQALVKQAFVSAATAFEKAAESATRKSEQRTFSRIAAECYAHIADHLRAAPLFERARSYTLAARHYRSAGQFDDTVRVMKAHEEDIDPDIAEEIMDVSKLFYLKGGQIEKAKDLFKTTDEAIDFADTFCLDAVRATFLEENCNYVEAAELRLEEGNMADAVRLFLRDGGESALQRACDCVLDRLWDTCHLGTQVAHNDARLVSSLSLIAAIPLARLTARQRNQLAMFKAIHQRDRSTLLTLYHESDDIAITITCLDLVYSNAEASKLSVSDAEKQVRQFWVYCTKLQHLLALRNPCEDPMVQKLLCFGPASSVDLFVLRPDSGLLALAPPKSQDEEGRLSKGVLRPLIMQAIRNHLNTRVASQNQWSAGLKVFDVCMHFMVDGRCRSGDECPRSHEPQLYRQRITILLLQICIYQMIDGFETRKECHERRRYWLTLLDKALHPAVPQLGAPHVLKAEDFPAGSADIALYWIREELFTLKPYPPFFLTQFLRSLVMHKVLSGSPIPHYINRIPRLKRDNPTWLLRGPTDLVQDAVRLFQRGSLLSGVLMIKHVLDEQSPLDLGVLCNTLDALCGALIFAHRRRSGSLHGVLLPRSWLLRISDRQSDTHEGLESLYVNSLGALLQDVYSGPLLQNALDRSSWAYRFSGQHIGYHASSAYLARICQNLCLLGYNISNYELREEIIRCLRALRRLHPPREANFHAIYERLITVTLWGDVVREVCSTAFRMGSSDEMVELWHSSKAQRAPPVANRNIRRMFFTAPQDIVKLLSTSAIIPKLPVNRPPTLVHLGPHLHTSSSEPPRVTHSPPGGEIPKSDTSIAEVGPKKEDTVVQDVTSVTLVDSNFMDTLSEDDLKKILRAVSIYRTAHRRRSTKLSPIRAKFASCVEFAKSSGMFEEDVPLPVRYYRRIYLGPFLHLLECAQAMNTFLRAEKAAAKKNFLDPAGHHTQLEEIRTRMTVLSALGKKADSLEKALDPRSSIHRERDLTRLKALVVEAQNLLRALPLHKVLKTWSTDLEIAYKGIVAVRTSARKLPPKLNTCDLDE